MICSAGYSLVLTLSTVTLFNCAMGLLKCFLYVPVYSEAGCFSFLSLTSEFLDSRYLCRWFFLIAGGGVRVNIAGVTPDTLCDYSLAYSARSRCLLFCLRWYLVICSDRRSCCLKLRAVPVRSILCPTRLSSRGWAYVAGHKHCKLVRLPSVSSWCRSICSPLAIYS